MVAVLGGLLVLLLVAGVAGAWLLLRDGGEPSPAAVDRDSTPGAASDSPAPGDDTTPTEDGSDSTAAALDPLGLGVEMLNQDCTGQYLVMLASTGTPKDYSSTLAPALERAADNHYLVTNGSCESFNQEVEGNPIYAAYAGPFDDMVDACAARDAQAYKGAYVRLLASDRDTRSVCECVVSESPYLTLGSGAQESVPSSYDVVDLQALLNLAGQNPDRLVDGIFTATTRGWVRRFQRGEGLTVTGDADVDTWSALRSWCED